MSRFLERIFYPLWDVVTPLRQASVTYCSENYYHLCQSCSCFTERFMPSPAISAEGILFSGCLSVCMYACHILTRKRAIAKALQLEGHPDFAPVDLAYYQHFLDFLFENIAFWEVPPGNHNCRSHSPRPFSTLNKQQIRTDFAVNLRCLLHTL